MKVLLTGPFTESDLHVLAAAVRQIERRRPAETFTMVFEAKDASLEEAEAMLKKTFPHIFNPVTGENEPIDIAVWKKQPEQT
jgi:hypothetical protein